MNKALLDDFTNPSSEYRGAPFWAWNGKLEPEELRWQIRVMQKMGLGGFFMHSRVGLDTAYLSDDWFRCVDACVDEAATLGMRAWLYDEDRWPSGAAGGLVTCNPKYRQRAVVMEILSKPSALKWTEATVAAFTAAVDGTCATDVCMLPQGSKPGRLPAGYSVLVFRVQIADCSSWYNGYTYLDTMNHEAVRAFIRATHEVYRKKTGKHFSKEIPGIFTDEPNHGRYAATSAPWTDALPRVFRQRYGYDMILHLPELFLEVDGCTVSRPRCHYHDCTTHLFVDAFARPIGEWCDKHGLQHTGHVLEEETLRSQTHVVGSAMRFYEYMRAPGMDILTEYNREYDTAKQVSSVARQFGRKWRLTETYGCTGWDFPFEGHKAIGDWQAALGINLRCQHLAWYTMLGQAKRDYPAGIFYHSPWWELYPKIEDYYARIHAVMTRGEEMRRVLVIHPIESIWSVFRGDGWLPAADEINASFVRVRDSLLQANIDFDYGDEDILARHGRTATDKGSPVLRVARAEYRTVIVPQMLTIRGSTLKLLQRFQRAGGSVVFAGEPPRHVDVLPSDKAAAFADVCTRAPASGKKLAAAVEREGRMVSIETANGAQVPSCLHLLREDKDAYYLFLCNTSMTCKQQTADKNQPRVRERLAAYEQVTVRLLQGTSGQPMELDAETGEMFLAEARLRKTGWEVRTNLPRLASRLFVFPKRAQRSALERRRKSVMRRTTKLAPAVWDITLSEDNVLVLDRPACRIGKRAWRKPEEILRVDRTVRAALDMPPRGGQMVQPWARKKAQQPRSIDVRLRYAFEAKALPSGSLFLAMERPETFDIRVNGVPVSWDTECGWWCDKALRKIPVDPSLIRLGTNEIELLCRYDENHSGLEIVYLLGDFGTAVKGKDVVMTSPSRKLRIGDWVKQGLAFYAGHVTYQRTIRPKLAKGERLFVRLPDYRGVAVRILVDGAPAGIAAWDPNEVDITDFVKGPSALLGIQVLGHRRNSHGPHHLDKKWSRWTGPETYQARAPHWHEGYQLVPCGLMQPPELIVKR